MESTNSAASFEDPRVTCSVQDCHKPVGRKGMCWGHLKRLQRGADLSADFQIRPEDRWSTVLEAVFDLSDLRPTDDEGWDKAMNRLRTACRRWAQEVGRKPEK